MNERNDHPGEQQLTALLDDRLVREQREHVEKHLETCEHCRGQVDALAGDDRWWNAATEYLSRDKVGTAPSDPDLDELKTVLAPSDDPRMLGRIGPYEIAGIIGSGGMGIVAKGWDQALSRYVAIKILRPSQSITEGARARFEREGRAAASIIHENVIAIHGVSQMQGHPYFVMPYIRGESLASRLHRRGPLSLDEMLRVGYQIASGLQAAHAQGLVHRDVKPSNILLDEGVDRLKLTDFGLVRSFDETALTRTGTLAGTPQFMSPEQAMGKPIDPRSDLFSLGTVLWTMSTGREPFAADSCYGVIKGIVDTHPPSVRSFDASLPVWWDKLIGRLMAKDPEQRFDSAFSVASVMQRCLAHVQNPTNPLPADLAGQADKRPIWFRAGAGVLFASMIAIGAYQVVQRSASPAPIMDSRPNADGDKASTSTDAPDTETFRWDDGVDQDLQRIRQGIQAFDSDSHTFHFDEATR